MEIIDFFKKSNSSFKGFILVMTLLLIITTMSGFKIGLGSPFFYLFFTSYFFLFIALFEGDIFVIVRWFLFSVLIIFMLIIIFAWIGGETIPYTDLKIDNNFMIVLFTMALTIATIINSMNSKRIMGFSRLSELDFYLNNILAVEIENKGNYPSRMIHMKTEIIKKRNSWGDFKEMFLSPERKRFYLSSKSRYAEKLGEYLETKYDIKRSKKYDKYISKKEISFELRITLYYSSDTFFKNPFPVMKIYKVKINSKGTEIREINPLSKESNL